MQNSTSLHLFEFFVVEFHKLLDNKTVSRLRSIFHNKTQVGIAILTGRAFLGYYNFLILIINTI